MNTKKWFVACALVLMGGLIFMPKAFCKTDIGNTKELKVYPIGKVMKTDGRTFIVIEKKFEPGLLRMDRLSSITVL